MKQKTIDQVIQAIEEFYLEHLYFPTLVKLNETTGIHPSVIYRAILELEKQSIIQRHNKQYRLDTKHMLSLFEEVLEMRRNDNDQQTED